MSNSNERAAAAEIPSTPFAFIWFAHAPYKRQLFFAFACVAIADTLGTLQSYTFKQFTDAATAYSSSGGSFQTVLMWVLAYPILLLLSSVFIRTSGFVTSYFTVYVRTGAIRKLFEYLSYHSSSYFNERFSGALSNKVTTVAQNTSSIVSQSLYSVFGFFITLISSSILIFSVDKMLALVFIGGFALLIPINLFLSRQQVTLSERMAKTQATLRGQVVDIVMNIYAVQAYSRRFFELTRLDKYIGEYREADVKRDYFVERLLVINNILAVGFIALIIYLAFSLWSREAITIGSLVMIVALTRGILRDFTWIGQNINRLMEMYGEMREGLNEIIVPHTIVDDARAKKLEINSGSVKFEEVTFAYSLESAKAFSGLSFEIKGGEKVGIVGASGAGKTTLMKLLLRQYDVLSGSIKIDDQDLRKVTLDSLRENVSIVPQEPMLFHRTIRENIMYGKLDATEDEMIEVAKKAQAHDFIESLPDKYDSLVGERGVKLSVGQRQRVIIARAFLKNAPILILDEATSALDSESEVAVQKALQSLMEGKTVFAIAHRLSTLRDMDRILVFKDGEIVEDGTHRTLLKKDGVYASFWGHQAGGFIKEI